MSEANKELARRHFEEIFNRKNLEVCDEIMAEDYVEHAAAPFSESVRKGLTGPRLCARPPSDSWPPNRMSLVGSCNLAESGEGSKPQDRVRKIS